MPSLYQHRLAVCFTTANCSIPNPLFAETHRRWLRLAVAVLVCALSLVSLDAPRTRRRIEATHPQ